MARSHAKLYTAIWNNADWRGLSMAAQWLYEALLSQSKLSLAGCLDLMPTRWASLCGDCSEYEIVLALGELMDGRFVYVDRASGEVVLRTFAANDLTAGPLNGNIVRGFWSAWGGIMSPTLRHLVVLNVPESLWDKSEGIAPEEAQRFRRSGQSEPEVAARFEVTVPDQFEPPKPLTYAVTEAEAAATADVLTVAATLLAEREADRRGEEIGNRAGYIRSRLNPIRREHEATWRARLEANPELTAEALIQLPQRPSSVRGVDHTEQTAAAAQARYEANQERLRGAACETCGGTHVVETEGGCVQCPTCTAPPSLRSVS